MRMRDFNRTGGEGLGPQMWVTSRPLMISTLRWNMSMSCKRQRTILRSKIMGRRKKTVESGVSSTGKKRRKGSSRKKMNGR